MIVGVAIRSETLTLRLPKPARHCDCFAHLKDLGIHSVKHMIGVKPGDQGFYTHTGRYLTREEAYKYVKRVKQQHDPDARKYLFSEDLW